jgi:hypothetical protein
MRTSGLLLLALGISAGASLTNSAPAFAKGRKGGGEAVPAANGEEIDKLKAVHLGDPKTGVFKWQMSPEEVMAMVSNSIAKRYQARIEGSSQDPGKQQRIRDEMEKEHQAVKKSYIKFEGQKTGLDVSIVGPEFQQNTSEAVLVTKEDAWTRYFFFFEGGLYKMFLAFNKEALEGKSFQEFGKAMEAKYGRAKPIYRDEKMKGGVRHTLDHFEWSAEADKLRLIDRSEFYGVYCLVLFDARTQDRVAQRREVVNPGHQEKDALVEAVTTRDDNSRDANDNIIDRVTGKQVKRPGEEEKHGDILVPSPTRSAGPADVNAKSPAAASDKDSGSKKKSKKGGDNALDGLEL